MKKNGKFDWEILMSYIFQHTEGYGNKNRPRRMSIHTIATMVGRNPLVILKEMEKSNLCLGYQCPDVGGACIFYLKELKSIMTDTPTKNAFNVAREQLKKWPIDKVKGFKRHSSNGDPTMPVPFDEKDAEYEKQLKIKLAEFRAS